MSAAKIAPEHVDGLSLLGSLDRVAAARTSGGAPTRHRRSVITLAACAVMALAVFLVVLTLIQTGLARERLSQRVQGTSDAVLQVMEDLLIEDPALLRSEVLQPMVAQFSRTVSFIQRISVIDRSLRIVADSDPALAGQQTDQSALVELLYRREERQFEYQRDGQRILRISRPLYGAYDAETKSHIFGAMSLDLQLSPIDGWLAADVARMGLMAGAVITLLGWIVLWLLPRRISLPLQELADVMARFGRGEGALRSQMRAEGPVMAVAEAFNRIADQMLQEHQALLEKVQESRQHEEQLRISEERFKALVESNVIGIMVADVTGHILEANEAFLKLLGYARDDVQAGSLWWNRMTPAEYQPLDELAIEKLKASRGCPPWEKECLRKDGRRVPVLVGVAPLGDTQERYLGFVLDLTERRRTEDALARLAAIVESSEDAIVGMSLEGTIISWNAGAEQMYGYPASAVLGKSICVIVPSHLSQETTELLEQVRRGEHIAHYETVRVKRNGQTIEVSLSLSPIRDAVGWVVGASSIARDITERRRAEEQIRRLNAELEQQLLQVTSVNKELEAFSYSVSHDLRAPLRSIDGFSQALLEDYAPKLDDDGKDYLRRVREASQHMGQLIDDMLQLARVTRGELKRESVSLSDIARSLAEDLRQRLPMRTVEFVIAEGLTVTGDGSLLRAVLQNLMENAWKFTSKVAEARIEVGVQERDGRPVYFVRDNGAGFDMAQAGRLFTAFQRLHAQSDFPGTGVGLATVQRIIHRHGGRIWAESAVGAGAAFYLTLG